ncbi:helix-turn-helix domain-containing protein, partial [Planobispora rosea]|uniref:helix-turn-helix domain-containing protein n=2 Tax=Planobispora rosea TaxID=35762 RepID=UPI001671811C
MSRSRRLRPLPDDLPEPVRVLLGELRALKERAGLDLRALEQATHASRSSWGRWLAGETWIPVEAVEGLARLCREDERRFRALWELADQARRMAGDGPETDDRDRVEAGGEPGTGATERVPEPGEAMEGAATSGGYGEPPGPGGEVSGPGRGASGPDREASGPDGGASGPGTTAPHGPAGFLRWRFRVGAVLGLSAGVVAGFMIAGSFSRSGASGEEEPVSTPTAARAEAITRAQVVARAKSWNPATAQRVPYS